MGPRSLGPWRALFALALLIVLLPEAVPPRSLGEQIERAVGRAAAKAAKGAYGAIEGGLLAAWVEGEAEEVGRAFPGWKFDVLLLDSSEPNAFSAPGGFVFVTWGLLNLIRSDDELAGVLAHEMAHSARHHMAEVTLKQVALSQALSTLKSDRFRWARRLGGWGLLLLALSDMRGCEREADSAAVRACLRTGYDPLGLASILDRLSGEGPGGFSELFMTHPPTSRRVARVRALAKRAETPSLLCRLGWSLLRRGRLGRAREEARRLGVGRDVLLRLETAFLPEPLELALPRCRPPAGEEARQGQKGQMAEEALEEARRAEGLVSELSDTLLGHQTAVQVAAWGARADLRWLAAYIEAVGLAGAFREALFSLHSAAKWVREAASSSSADLSHYRDDDLGEAVKALREATEFLARARRAVRPNILCVLLSALSRGEISAAQLAMLQTSFLAAQRWLQRSVERSGRTLEAAGRARVEREEARLNRLLPRLSDRQRGLAVELAVRRLGGDRAALVALLRRGLPFGTACVLLGAASEAGKEPLALAGRLSKGASGAELLADLGVYAPDLAIVLRLVEGDISEALSV